MVDGGDPVGTIVTAEASGDEVIVTIDDGKAGTTGDGDFAGDVALDCTSDSEPDLLASWFVRIDRQARS